MSNNFSSRNLRKAFPYALTLDSDKSALGRVVADELENLYNDNDRLSIYARISELDEDLLDILAKDLNVGWYLYEGTPESKRAQIESSFYVHRHLGTKAAMVAALSDLCPGTEVQEWPDYAGKPYHFRVILDLSGQNTPITLSTIVRYINIFKSLRSILDGELIYRSRISMLLGLSINCVSYTTRLCGTQLGSLI